MDYHNMSAMWRCPDCFGFMTWVQELKEEHESECWRRLTRERDVAHAEAGLRQGEIQVLTERIDELEAERERLRKNECHHGWRGTVPDGAAGKIANRCPSCGLQSLFLGSGGWLTCSNLGCKAPCAATDVIDAARKGGAQG